MASQTEEDLAQYKSAATLPTPSRPSKSDAGDKAATDHKQEVERLTRRIQCALHSCQSRVSW
jgi:hypothetical protein